MQEHGEQSREQHYRDQVHNLMYSGTRLMCWPQDRPELIGQLMLAPKQQAIVTTPTFESAVEKMFDLVRNLGPNVKQLSKSHMTIMLRNDSCIKFCERDGRKLYGYRPDFLAEYVYPDAKFDTGFLQQWTRRELKKAFCPTPTMRNFAKFSYPSAGEDHDQALADMHLKMDAQYKISNTRTIGTRTELELDSVPGIWFDRNMFLTLTVPHAF